MRRLFALIVLSLLLSGCVTGYTMVDPVPVKVANGKMMVQPTIAWNRVPRGPYDISQEESWTLNGPTLDTGRIHCRAAGRSGNHEAEAEGRSESAGVPRLDDAAGSRIHDRIVLSNQGRGSRCSKPRA